MFPVAQSILDQFETSDRRVRKPGESTKNSVAVDGKTG